MVLAHIIRPNGFRVTRGDAVGTRFAAHLVRVAPHGNDNVRLALYLIAGGVAEADVRGINQLHRNIALDRLTGLKRRIKVHVEASIAVHTGVFQQRARRFGRHRVVDPPAFVVRPRVGAETPPGVLIRFVVEQPEPLFYQ